MNDSSNGASDQTHDDYSEDEYQEAPPGDQKREKSGTPLSTWVAVFGSSTIFHVLLLILLGMIVISQPQEEQEEVTLQIPEEEEEQQKKITRRDVEKEVEKETDANNPTVETTDDVSEVQSDMQSETGQSLDFTSETSNNSPAERSIALGGGGGGGTYGSRGQTGLSSDGGGSSAERQAVKAALIWLARHQNEDGYWEVNNYSKQCPDGNKCEVLFEGKSKFNTGITGLAMLAFLGAGYTHESNVKLDGIDIGDVVLKSLRWLKNRQKNNGTFDTTDRQMYNHSITAMAYAEAYGMTGDPKLKRIAQKAINFIEHAQNTSDGKRLAWRYTANSGENDTSVTGWAAMALKSAELAGLDTNKKTMDGALRWVEQVTNKRGLTGYQEKINTRSQLNEHRSLTAVGMLIRMFAQDDDERIEKKQLNRLHQGAEFLVNVPPQWDEEITSLDQVGNEGQNFYHWYYGSLALYLFAGPGTQFEDEGYWQKWNRPMKNVALTSQEKARSGHEVGSWDPLAQWAYHGGRVYATAINTLTLEVYYRYDNALFQ